MKKQHVHTPKLKQTPVFSRSKLLVLIAVLSIVGAYFVIRSLAANGSMTLVPSSTTVNIGSTVTVAVRVNSGTDPVNFTQANLAFDATKLQYMSVDETGSAYPLIAETQVGTGTLNIGRATNGGSAPNTGDDLVTTVTFKALAAGPAPITISSGSILVRSTDNTDILTIKNNTSLTLTDTSAPTVPASLVAPTIGLTSVSLSWAASTDNVGVTSYKIYRGGTLLNTTANTSYTDSGLTPGTVYSYTVAAVDAAGNTSAQSTAVAVTTTADTAAPTVPGKPASSTQTMTTITLSWTGSTDNVAVTSYRVYRNGSLVGSPTVTSFTDSGLVPSTSYSYTIAAIDAKNNLSAQSAATAVSTLADTQAPTVPAGLSGSVSGQNVILSWSASTDNVAVTTYLIFRDGTQIATTGTPGYTVVNATSGSHVYTVAARDAIGNTSAQATGVTLNVYLASDIDHNNRVNGFDISILLSSWQSTTVLNADINHDGIVNGFDLSIILSNWTG